MSEGQAADCLIRQMRPGQEGYTVPWVVMFTDPTTARINSRYFVCPAPEGTSQLLVRCTEAGYEIEIGTALDGEDWEMKTAAHAAWCDTPVARVIDRRAHRQHKE